MVVTSFLRRPLRAAGDMSPAQFSDYLKSEIAKWGSAVKASGAKADF